MEPSKKTGFWTQHVDPSNGRTYYFNMAIGRSVYELPLPLQTQVKTPTLDALRAWDSESAERKYGAAYREAGGDHKDDLRQKREEALAKCRSQAVEARESAPAKLVSLEERMALAAKKRKAEEVKHLAGSNKVLASASSSEYLDLVRQLQQPNDGEEGTGGKWLVR
uniref:WW domain-containing protein n=1 Tax=Peronospora matthiolae TaxID=2874970 RepID=A0AAV1UP25_9STRA